MTTSAINKYIFSCLITMLCITNVQSQNWRDFISDDKSYFQIVEEVEHFYNQKKKRNESLDGYKQFMRWQFDARNHIGRDNRIEYNTWDNHRIYKNEVANISANRAAHGDWNNIGPFDYWVGDVFSGGGVGRINCAAFHPADSSIIYVGSPAGGVWKTEDEGNTWTPLTDQFSRIGVSGVAIHPVNPDTLYVLTGDGDGGHAGSIGVIKSNDGGMNWELTSNAVTSNGFELVMHPTNPDTMWVPYSRGILTTTDGWDTFTQTFTIGDTVSVWDIEIKPSNFDSLYAASDTGLLVSVDAGQTWVLDNDPDFPASYARMDIAISPSAPNNLYALFGGENGIAGSYHGLFKSTDGGAEFDLQSSTPNILASDADGSEDKDQASYDICIAVDPLDDSAVYVAGINLWRSQDSGATWGRLTWKTRNEEPVIPYVHADWHNIYFQNGNFWSCNDGGFYKSVDNGGEWEELSADLCIMQFYEIDVLNNEYIGGTQDNGTNGAEFTNTQCQSILGGDGFGCIWSTGNTNVQFLTTQSSLARREAGSNIFIWQEADGFWYSDLHMHETNSDYFFIKKGKEIFRASQNLAIWDYSFENLGLQPGWSTEKHSGSIDGFSQCEDNPEVMYVSNNFSLQKTTNLSNASPTWDSITHPDTLVWLGDIVVDLNDENRVWCTGRGYAGGRKVYYSENGGTSWTNISGTLPNVPVRCITHDTTGMGALYLGTEIGVYYRDSTMTDWSFFGNYLPNTAVTELIVRDGFITAATYGRGIWRSPVFSCQANAVLTLANDPSPSSIGHRNILRSNSITSSRVLQGVNVDVKYGAGDEVTLLPGFVAGENVKWEARIAPCPQ